MILFVYNLALLLALVVGAPWWLFRLATTQKYREGLRYRLGKVPELEGRRGRPLIWVHAVSVGEVLAVSRLVKRLDAILPGHFVAISTTTRTGQALARERFGAERVFYCPLDLPWAIRSYLNALEPELLILAETEFWPNLLHGCFRRGIPVAVVNARVSDRSWPRYRMLRPLWRPFLSRITRLLAQGDTDAERLVEIGCDPDRVSIAGNMKFDVRAAWEVDATRILNALRLGKRLVVAGSTLEGEEAALLDAWPQLLEVNPRLVLVIAPRHPERFDAVAGLLAESRFHWKRRTDWFDLQGGAIKPLRAGEIVLLDTIGELASIYSLASVAFVGGSLVNAGGHNPLEPAQFGVPILIGPDFSNFRDITEHLLAKDAIRITEPEGFAAALIELLTDRASATAMGERGRHVFEQQSGATERCVTAIKELLGVQSEPATQAPPEATQPKVVAPEPPAAMLYKAKSVSLDPPRQATPVQLAQPAPEPDPEPAHASTPSAIQPQVPERPKSAQALEMIAEPHPLAEFLLPAQPVEPAAVEEVADTAGEGPIEAEAAPVEASQLDAYQPEAGETGTTEVFPVAEEPSQAETLGRKPVSQEPEGQSLASRELGSPEPGNSESAVPESAVPESAFPESLEVLGAGQPAVHEPIEPEPTVEPEMAPEAVACTPAPDPSPAAELIPEKTTVVESQEPEPACEPAVLEEAGIEEAGPANAVQEDAGLENVVAQDPEPAGVESSSEPVPADARQTIPEELDETAVVPTEQVAAVAPTEATAVVANEPAKEELVAAEPPHTVAEPPVASLASPEAKQPSGQPPAPIAAPAPPPAPPFQRNRRAGSPVRKLLLPISPLYRLGQLMTERRQAANQKALRRLRSPVVSIGNLSTGGAGKTPMTIALAKALSARGIQVDVLSRGYGRTGQNPLRVNPAGTAEQFGDEPLLIARAAGVPVYVAGERYDAGLLAEGDAAALAFLDGASKPCIHLLDDGFQHRQLARDVDILLLDWDDWTDSLLPAGNLREPLTAIRRAHILAIPKGDSELEDELKAWGWTGPLWKISRNMTVPPIQDSAFAFCGIARPQQFFAGIEAGGVRLAAHMAFPDHHVYTAKDVQQIARKAETAGASTLLTTEKDLARLSTLAASFSGGLSLRAVGLETGIAQEEAAIQGLLNALKIAVPQPAL